MSYCRYKLGARERQRFDCHFFHHDDDRNDVDDVEEGKAETSTFIATAAVAVATALSKY